MLKAQTKPQKIEAQPVLSGERIDFVDILRGFALFGVLSMNITAFSGQSLNVTQIPDSFDKLVVTLVNLLMQAKFYSMFSFLFGWGMSVQMERASARGANFVKRYLRRLFVLLVIGLVHAVLIWFGDILLTYALDGFLLILFRKRSAKVLAPAIFLCLLLSIVMTLPGNVMTSVREWIDDATHFLQRDNLSIEIFGTGNYWEVVQFNLQSLLRELSRMIYTFGNIFSMFLLGLLVGKRRVFQNIEQHTRLLWIVLVVGLVIGGIFNSIFVYAGANPGWVPAQYQRTVTVGARTIGAPALMLFYVSGIILLLRRKSWHERLAPLGDLGRMALTNYLTHSVVFTLLFYNYGLGLYGETSATFNQVLVVIMYLAQIRFSTWWFERYQFGPAEWLWRALTYGKRPPFRVGERYDNLKPPSWILTIRRVSAKIPPLAGLAAVWIMLIAWGAGLVAWNMNLTASSNPVPFKVVVQVTANASAENAGGQSPENANGGESLAPKLEAVKIQPGKIVTSGDIWALAGTFDIEEAYEQIEELSDPVYQGRSAASPGGWAAGDYIADQFAAFGLQPLGENGTYFQEFPVVYTPLKGVPRLTVTKPGGDSFSRYKLHEDFSPVVRWYSGPGKIRGALAWLDNCASADFTTLIVVEKVVLCNNTADEFNYIQASRLALEHGAAGLLLLTDPNNRAPDMGNTFYEVWVPQPIPTFMVYTGMVTDLLSGSGLNANELVKGRTPVDLATEVAMEISTAGTEACAVEECLARNILGALPGRDPAYADEVVILGAHYDHIGAAPDGLVWLGANDDASGVAILLEIARSWQEQGFQPMRTVIFAAWDAEEIGLIGSHYYTQHPSFPLAKTLAMFQLDMVGAGPGPLNIGGQDRLSAELYRVAEALGIDAQVYDGGRSDHAPFSQAGVPASLLIYFDEIETYKHYHRPTDTIEVIEADRLREAAAMLETTLLDLVESEPLIEQMLAERAAAAEASDLSTFIGTSSLDQQAVDTFWFDELNAQPVSKVSIDASNIEVNDDHANAQVEIRVVYRDERGAESVANGTLEAAFVRQGVRWLWDGPTLAWVDAGDTTGVFPVAYTPDEASPQGLGETAALIYAAKARRLGLSGEPDSTLMLLPDSQTIRLSTSPSLPPNQAVWVSADHVKLIYSPEISTSVQLDRALSQLILAEAGIDEAAAPWLWQGLPLVFESQEDLKEAHIRYIPRLSGLLDGTDEDQVVAAWAATDYLLWRLGWEQLGVFISNLGQACQEGLCEDSAGLDAVLENTLGTDSAAFQGLWRSYWKGRLETVQSNLDELLRERVEAIEQGDRGAFLATVDPEVARLKPVQGYWYDDQLKHRLVNISLSASPLVLFEDGSVLTTVSTSYQMEGEDSRSTETEILFTRNREGYLWAGSPLDTLDDEGIQVRYPDGWQELAEALLSDGKSFYTHLAEQLEIEDPENLTISLYEDQESYSTAIALSFRVTDWSQGWTAPDGDVKLLVNSDQAEAYHANLAIQLARNLMHQAGVGRGTNAMASEWLLKGVSAYLSGPLDRRVTQNEAAAVLPNLSVAAVEDRLPDLETMLPDDKLTKDKYNLALCQAWDAVRYMVNTYGLQSNTDLIHTYSKSTNAFQATTGRSLAAFQAEWAGSLAGGHILPEWIDVSRGFSQDQAQGDISVLAARDLKGRPPGSPGARIAAEYIADQFAAAGLVPAGDGNSVGASYFQTFPISDTQIVSGPRFELLDRSGRPWKAFSLRDEYLALRPVSETVGIASGEVVLIQDMEAPEEIDLTGKIVLLMLSGALRDKGTWEAESAWAVEQGASGLVVIGNKQEPEDTQAKQPLMLTYEHLSRIPVFELTWAGYKAFLDAIGLDVKEMKNLHSGEALDMSIMMDFSLARARTIETNNVLGLLPGADPLLSQELVIVGADYDHVGDDPDQDVCLVSETGETICETVPGKLFSGANDNASGVAMMLEIARLWQREGYRPRRSVLFAAWGAQELGELGSRYFTKNPTVPLDKLQGMVQLSSVADGDGFNTGAYGNWLHDGLLLYNIRAAGILLEEKVTIDSKLHPGDYLPFDEIGGPSLLVSWRLADNNNLSDGTTNALIPQRLGIVGRLITLVLMGLAR